MQQQYSFAIELVGVDNFFGNGSSSIKPGKSKSKSKIIALPNFRKMLASRHFSEKNYGNNIFSIETWDRTYTAREAIYSSPLHFDTFVTAWQEQPLQGKF